MQWCINKHLSYICHRHKECINAGVNTSNWTIFTLLQRTDLVSAVLCSRDDEIIHTAPIRLQNEAVVSLPRQLLAVVQRHDIQVFATAIQYCTGIWPPGC